MRFILLALLLTGCAKKQQITPNDFKNTLETMKNAVPKIQKGEFVNIKDPWGNYISIDRETTWSSLNQIPYQLNYLKEHILPPEAEILKIYNRNWALIKIDENVLLQQFNMPTFYKYHLTKIKFRTFYDGKKIYLEVPCNETYVLGESNTERLIVQEIK